jgi:hypothetical protein
MYCFTIFGFSLILGFVSVTVDWESAELIDFKLQTRIEASFSSAAAELVVKEYFCHRRMCPCKSVCSNKVIAMCMTDEEKEIEVKVQKSKRKNGAKVVKC